MNSQSQPQRRYQLLTFLHIFNLREETLILDNVEYKFKVQVAVYLFGGFSIRVRYQMADGTYNLISKMTFDTKIDEFLRIVVAKAKKKVETALSKITTINNKNKLSEAYRFYYIEGKKSQILAKSKKLIAGLLIDENNAETPEAEYIDYILGKNISYDASNVLFVGWESAVMIDEEYPHEQELLISEIANLQLLEMRIYHSNLTEKLDSASKVLNSIDTSIFTFGTTEIRNLNKSLGRVYDNTRTVLNNINDTVFGLGEWYLSRVYSLFSSVFKISELQLSIQGDLEAIDNERKFVSDIEVSKHEAFLELVIIALIVIEILIEMVVLLK